MDITTHFDKFVCECLQTGLRSMALSQEPQIHDCATLLERAAPKLLKFLELLHKWNKAYNLTSVRDPEEMVVRHLLDSLSILPWVKGPKVLDIGSGGGLPGIPLAICLSELSFTLLDSNGKKTRFLQQAATELSLPNLQIVNARVENFQPAQSFDQITSRAFSALTLFMQLATPKLQANGELLAMKGRIDPSELLELQQKLEPRCLDVIPLSVPMLNEERHLVIIKP
ncbi:Methyltransferase, glucose inhibited division protein B [gamma proteobacterium HdN1]|nr:Methyltransferase, glucose inhibited division protein B [gamma proteobacterium HdN1]